MKDISRRDLGRLALATAAMPALARAAA